MIITTSTAAAGLAVADIRNAPVASSARVAQTDGRPRRTPPQSRRYEVVHLLPNGDIGDFSKLAPATAAFEDGFGAMARGALLKTMRGVVAIEDILPGDAVHTVTNGFQTVYWRGSMTLLSNTLHQSARRSRLIRVAADALGIARPMSDLMLGPSARLYHRSPTLQRITGHEAAFVPIGDFVDGVNIVEVTPQSPVAVYQLGFARHERIVANGVELDSHHPGARHDLGLRSDDLALYMQLFPHKTRLDDFGLLLSPRLSMHDLDFGVVA